jgi:outer membrane biogenesis lipoprotein LolB
MRHLNVSMLFVCFAALLFIFACADTSKKPAEAPNQTAEETKETPTQAAETVIEEVTLAVTGMT